AARTDPQTALKGMDTRTRSRRRWAMRDVLVAAQVAICFVLVSGCLLALRGLQSALTMQLGFVPTHVEMVGYDLGLAGYTPARGADFERRALEAVRRLPGIEAAAFADTLPLYLNQSNTTVTTETDTATMLAKKSGASAARFTVSSDFFRTLGIRI